MVTNRDRKSFRSPRKNSKFCSDNWQSWRFWSAFRHFGTHYGESFRMYRSSWIYKGKKIEQIFASANLTKKWINAVQSVCNIHNCEKRQQLRKSMLLRRACTDLNKNYMKVRSYDECYFICYIRKEPSHVLVPVCRKHWLVNISISVRL